MTTFHLLAATHARRLIFAIAYGNLWSHERRVGIDLVRDVGKLSPQNITILSGFHIRVLDLVYGFKLNLRNQKFVILARLNHLDPLLKILFKTRFNRRLLFEAFLFYAMGHREGGIVHFMALISRQILDILCILKVTTI